MKTFFDSSAFAKRFIEESGSDKVENCCRKATALGLSVICVPEIISALNRRHREKTLSQGHYATAKCRLLEDVRDADIINLTSSVIGASIMVLESCPGRAMDALHIACALEWGAEIFVSSDRQQITAAKVAGLKTCHV